MAETHLIKLVVGLNTLDEFRRWQARETARFDGQKVNLVRTRFKPKQAEELIAQGASIYRVIGGNIRCRQKLVGFDTIMSADRGEQCLILTETEIIPTVPTPKRPFQGWRYLKAEQAPADLEYDDALDEGAVSLAAELKQAGIL